MHRVCFFVISCQANKEKVQTFIDKEDVYIITGKADIATPYVINQQFITVKAGDGYLDLPSKTMLALEVFGTDRIFEKYTHVYKIDDDCRITRPVTAEFYQFVTENPYCGSFVYHIWDPQAGDRNWHVDRRANSTHAWYRKPYDGHFVPWARGSNYVLRRDLVLKINLIWHSGNTRLLRATEVFEDLAVGKVCFFLNVKPKLIPYLDRIVKDEFDEP